MPPPSSDSSREREPNALDIAAVLAEEIKGKSPGERLGTEHSLMKRFGVSRSVIRKGLDNLESRLLIRRARGSGTYVNDRIDYPMLGNTIMSVRMTAQSTGASGESRVLHTAREPLSLRQESLFNVSPDWPVLCFTRVAFINGEPSIRTRDWVLPESAQGLDSTLSVFNSLSDSLRAHGHAIKRGRSVFSVEDMPTEVRRDLQLEVPVLGSHLESIVTDISTGEALVVSDTWFRLDCIRLIFDRD